MKDNRTLEKLAAGSIALATIMLLVAYLLVDTLGPDGVNHTQWLRSFPSQVWQGDIRPTWLSEAFEGLGSPTFYFYPPLVYWVATPLYPLVSHMSGAAGYCLLAFVGSCLAYLGFRFYLRTNGVSGAVILWAPLLYAVAPFRMYELFTRSGLSAHFAVGFIPLVLAGIDGLVQGKRKAKYFAVLSLSYAALVLTNLPIFVLTSVVVVIYLAILVLRKEENLIQVLLAMVCAASFAAFYLVPIPTMLEYVQSTKLMVIRGLPADGIQAVMNLVRRFDITESAQSTLNLFTDIALLTLLIVFFRRNERRSSRQLLFALLCVAIVTFFQITLLSGPVWSIDAIRTLIQFPHRWSVILVLAMCIAYAMLDDQDIRKWLLIGVTTWGIASAGFSTLAAFDLRVHQRGEVPAPLEPPEYATIYSPKDKYEVVAIAKTHATDPQIAATRALLPGESVTETLHDNELLRYRVSASAAVPVVFQQWRWPYWKLYRVGGQEIVVGSDPTGRMTAVLPPGEATYELRLTKSAEEVAGEYISLAALLLAAGYYLYLRKQDKQRLTSSAT